MTDLEYRLIKEAVKQEILQEMKRDKLIKPETPFLEVRKKQQAIFDECFPELRQLDPGRYWRIKEAVTKLTNLCRFRSNKCGAWDSSVGNEVEAESAIATYRTICEMSAGLIGKLS